MNKPAKQIFDFFSDVKNMEIGKSNVFRSLGIGIMLLFGSKDISTLIISSYPPLGAVSIAFMGLASYMVCLGVYSAASFTARDKKLRRDLREKVENNMMLLKSIASSQRSNRYRKEG